jgi:hypothetical protein
MRLDFRHLVLIFVHPLACPDWRYGYDLGPVVFCPLAMLSTMDAGMGVS